MLPALISAYLERALLAGGSAPRTVLITVIWPLAIKVVDAYAEGEGTLDVRLLGRTMQRERGPEMAVGEAMRYLAELPLVPHAMVHNGELA